MLKAILFDLDGTLLPFDEKEFIKIYFKLLYDKVRPYGYTDFEALVNALNLGTLAMYKNDGKKTNEAVFFETFENLLGPVSKETREAFDDFYCHEFNETRSCFKKNAYAKDIVRFVKDNVGIIVLATNPIFPYQGTRSRLNFLGLDMDDFDLVSTYENFSYSKPNPMYFIDILNRLNLKPEEVIMFGNNDYEDYLCASKVGIKTYLVDGYLIKHEEMNVECEIIKMEEIIDTIKKEICMRK